MNRNKIKLLIVDDHPIVRLGLSAVFKVQKDIVIVGVAEDGAEALTILSSEPVDVVLVDLRMPGLSGIETLKRISQVAPAARSIILSSFELDEEIYAATKAGAQGFLHKETAGEDILRAVRSVAAGKQAFPKRIAEKLSVCGGMTAGLSPRELEILELVAKGLTNKEVAEALQISQFTVRSHLNHITSKLEVSDRTEASFVAIQTGLITLH